MAVADLSIQVPREKVMDFLTVPHYYEYLTVLLRRPDTKETKWMAFLKPFDRNVLLCIGCTLCIVVFILVISEKTYSSLHPSIDSGQSGEAFFYILGAMFAEGMTPILTNPYWNSHGIAKYTRTPAKLVNMADNSLLIDVYCSKCVVIERPIYINMCMKVEWGIFRNCYKYNTLWVTTCILYYECNP